MSAQRALAIVLIVVAAAPLLVSATTNSRQEGILTLKLLALNDLHGHLETTARVGNRPVGGAAVLASYLRQRKAANPDRTFLVHAGDIVGASPPISALLHDEPSIEVLNVLGFAAGAVGNHEFDQGVEELLRLQNGGCHPAGCALPSGFGGAAFKYLAANVVDTASGQTLFPAYTVLAVDGVRFGLIGLVLQETPTIVVPTRVAGLRFEDEVEAGNRAVAELKRQGVRTIVVLIHQGGERVAPGSPSDRVEGPIVRIAAGLDDEVDLVVSGHTHRGYRALIGNKLLTQAFSFGTAFADIDLDIDRASGDVVDKRAEIVTTFADVITPDPTVAEMVSGYAAAVAPVVSRVLGAAAAPIRREQNAAGESPLGNLIADAQRAKSDNARIAFMNPGGIRDDLPAGQLTYGQLFTVQPFGNSLVSLDLTGEQLLRLLEQQWQLADRARLLQVSRGFRYVWDARRPIGDRVVSAFLDDRPLDPAATYRVAVNSFLAAGGDAFTVLTEGSNPVGGPLDLDALVEYVQEQPQPLRSVVEGRITRLD